MRIARTPAAVFGAALFLGSAPARAQAPGGEDGSDEKKEEKKNEAPSPATEAGKDLQVDDHHEEQKIPA